ncbi:MAG: Phosphomannomutase/phosphoglucomutase [Candidatus Celerinatantimonas neptuna]|nr:MAG: Phosphomannomutase/phosphoglucomutase [Candidatus Celerinatantimonas neptuna]
MSILNCFKAYDIRGKLGEELNEQIAYRIGRAYAQHLIPKTIAIGCDVRLSSESLKKALANGLMDGGVDVVDLGMTGTEEVYYASQALPVDGGIEVTASHNPMNYNGMKLVTKDARPISGDSGLKDIESLVVQNQFCLMDPELRGQYSKCNNLPHYVAHLLTYINAENFKPLKLVVNSGNGAAGHVIDAIEDKFNQLNIPIEFIKVHHEADGHFPNGIPNPLLPENRADTINAVIEHNADFGIAWDGDFDRCFFFDEKGQFIEGYYIVGLLAEAFLQKQPGAKIIHDPRLSWNTIDVVKKSGGVPIMSKTGHAFIKERMRREDAIYGGEMSAHHYFKTFGYCDSGMIPWLLIAELLCVKHISLSQAVQAYINAYPSSGEINSTLTNPEVAISFVRAKFEPEALFVDETDGISLEFSDWRFNLRCSNTEPVVRLNVESRKNLLLMQMKTEEILTLLRQV